MSDEIKQFRLETFQPHIDTDFTITLLDEEGNKIFFVLTLRELESIGEKERDIVAHGRESFSLIFEHDSTEKYLVQGTYAAEHANLGTVTLFFVPLGLDGNRMRYEVIFT